MAHFAELNKDNIVARVIVVGNPDCLDENGNESENIGIAFCQSITSPNSIWVQTSYNANIRGKYASIGDTYREDLDMFIPPQPYPSWSLDESIGTWEAPVSKPDDENPYVWNEETQSWNLLEPPTT
jgi:hypothetical protein